MRLLACRLVAAGCAVLLFGCAPATAPDAEATSDPAQQALVSLKDAVQREPASAKARSLLGLALLEQGQAAQAVIELEKAASLGLPPSQAWPPIARALLEQGQPQQVIDRYKVAALPAGEAAADLQTSVAAAYAAQGRREAATAAVQQALRLSPQYTTALLLQVRLLGAAGDLNGAQHQLEALLSAEPKNAYAWQLSGDLLERQGASAPAVAQAYRRSIDIRPDRVRAHAGLVAALLREGDVAGARQQANAMRAARPVDPQTAFALAQVSLAEGDLKTANALAQTALRGLPEEPRLLQFAGLTALQLGAPLEAEPPLLKSLQLAPEAALTRHLLAATYLVTGQPGKLETVLEPLLQTADPQALLQLAQARLQAGRPAAAQALRQRLPADKAEGAESHDAPDASHAERLRIEGLIASRQLDAAGAALDSLAARQPGQPATAHLQGRLRLAQRDAAGARAAFERALLMAPAYQPSALALAALDAQAGKPALAEVRLQTLSRRHPGDPQVRLAYAGQLQRMGKAQAAEVALQDGAAAMNGNAELLDALARLQLQEREYGQALRTLTKLAALRPDAADTPLRMAEAHVGLGETLQARQALQRALVLRPGSLPAQRGLVSLALLERQPAVALALARQVQQQPGALGVGRLLEGDVLMAGGDTGGAATAYLDGLRRAPSTELAAKAHAALLAQGRADEAAGVAADWRRAHPRDADFAVHLGNGAQARGDAAAAERNFQEAVRLQPLHALALNNLAMAMLQLGHRGALAYAERAAALLPDSSAVADTLAQARRAERQPAWAAASK